MSTLHVLVVEDEALVAAMIREALSGSTYEVRSVAFTKNSAIKYLQDNHYDVALLDINLDGKFEGIDVGRHIRDHHKFPFLYLTAHADDQTLQNAKLTQPSGYIIKPFTERELLAGLEVSLYNHVQQTRAGFAMPDFDQLNAHLTEPLSRREIDVLQLLYQGKSNLDISETLHLSINTIKTHLGRLYSKFDVNSRTAVIASVRDILK